MKLHYLAPLAFVLLTACVDTTGLSAESSRPPKGNPNASVLVEEFADLQCPACRASHTLIVKPLIEKYGSQVRFEFKHFPLRSIHRFALDAAEASECAADQGKFWEFVDVDYEKQPDMNEAAIRGWAEGLKLDMALFDRCVASGIKRDTIMADYDAGRERDVGGTPTFFVNGQRVETDLAKISEAIDASLTGAVQRL